MYLIYQHGKVASQTVEWSIRHSDETAKVERHHYLCDKVLSEIGRICDLEAINPTGISADVLASARAQLLGAQKVREEILNSNQPIFVITGFRDPLDLAISAFFQNVTTFCPWLTFESQDIRGETDRVMEVFNHEFDRFMQRVKYGTPAQTLRELNLNQKYEDLDRWFDRELLGVLGINVFDHHVGTEPIVRFREGRFTVLLYRLETLGASLTDLLRQLPLAKGPVIRTENIGSTKVYGPLYANFKSRFLPSSAMSEYYYGGRYFEHFYPESRPLYCAAP